MTALFKEAAMDSDLAVSIPDPERSCAYLRILAEAQLCGPAGVAIDPSDIVQQTLLDAYRDRDRFRGRTEAERLAWLRRLLACNLVDAMRARGCASGMRPGSDRWRRCWKPPRPGWEPCWRPINPPRARGPGAMSRSSGWSMPWPDCPSLTGSPWCCAIARAYLSRRSASGWDAPREAVAGLLKRGLAELRTILPDERE